jgi:type II secretory pathway component GspD/PulD (secretin)
MKNSFKYWSVFILLLLNCPVMFSQARVMPVNFEFINQNINDVMYVFSTFAKTSIIADNSISGNVTFQFSGDSFDEAFDAFLLINRLYVEKNTALWIVSRTIVAVNDDKIRLDALDATPSQILEKLSTKTNTTIVHDILPSAPISIHVENESLRDIISLVMKRFNEYIVTEEDGYLYIRRNSVVQNMPNFSGIGEISIQENDGLFDVTVEQARFGDVLERLFFTAKKEYASFIPPDTVIYRVRVSGKSFEDALALILQQGNGEYMNANNFWYIFPSSQTDVIRRLRDVGKIWRRFTLKYITLDECLPLIQNRFDGYQIHTLANTSDFLIFTDAAVYEEILAYIMSIDIPKRSTAVKLKYISTEDLFKALPPSVKREELIDAGNGNTVFFTGSAERLKVFSEDLAYIDRPRPRIRYDLLILQFESTTNLVYGTSFEARTLEPGDMTVMSGTMGGLLNLNFDAISVFGYNFAAKLNAALSENEANVFADTTLFGLSGQEIQFQNTSTYRYRDSNIDPETGRPIYSGVTREIISGLMLKISGWVSGDGMITTTVNAAVSKRGADVSTTVGNPPPTSEKVLTTQVRGRSGETVILSGLKQDDSMVLVGRTPFLSKIPLLGTLFKQKDSSTERTQMVIYLVPHIDLSNEEYTVEGRKTQTAYERFVEPFWESAP